jgi:hypothetical protein
MVFNNLINIMGCFERFMDWLNFSNMPQSEQSIIRDLIEGTTTK